MMRVVYGLVKLKQMYRVNYEKALPSRSIALNMGGEAARNSQIIFRPSTMGSQIVLSRVKTKTLSSRSCVHYSQLGPPDLFLEVTVWVEVSSSFNFITAN